MKVQCLNGSIPGADGIGDSCKRFRLLWLGSSSKFQGMVGNIKHLEVTTVDHEDIPFLRYFSLVNIWELSKLAMPNKNSPRVQYNMIWYQFFETIFHCSLRRRDSKIHN